MVPSSKLPTSSSNKSNARHFIIIPATFPELPVLLLTRANPTEFAGLLLRSVSPPPTNHGVGAVVSPPSEEERRCVIVACRVFRMALPHVTTATAARAR